MGQCGRNRCDIFDGDLVDTEQKNRMYDMKVELYKSGAGFDSSDVLTSFDAASLE